MRVEFKLITVALVNDPTEKESELLLGEVVSLKQNKSWNEHVLQYAMLSSAALVSLSYGKQGRKSFQDGCIGGSGT